MALHVKKYVEPPGAGTKLFLFMTLPLRGRAVERSWDEHGGAVVNRTGPVPLPTFHGNSGCNSNLADYVGCDATGREIMKQSEMFRENAENCAHLAESAAGEPAFQRYKRMEAAWRALADEQDWLDGEVSPVPSHGRAFTRTGAAADFGN